MANVQKHPPHKTFCTFPVGISNPTIWLVGMFVLLNVTLASAAPDLTVTTMTAPSSSEVGGTASVSAMVSNLGTSMADASQLEFFLSSDNIITTSDIDTTWGCYVPALAAGESYPCSGPISFPSLGAGAYYFGAITDVSGAVTETNENNNWLAASSPTQITGAVPTFSLSVTKSGTGTGTVTSSPSGISCGDMCTYSFASAATITLTAGPAVGSTFMGWSGACSGMTACQVTMNSTAQNVTATFFNTMAVETSNLLVNPGLENGVTGWTENSTGGYAIITNDSYFAPHIGGWYAWFGGYDSGIDTLFQDVIIPAGTQHATFQFWYQILTDESSADNTAWDTMAVEIYDPDTDSKLTSLTILSNLNSSSGWVQTAPYDLSAYRGQAIRLKFTAVTDGSLPTNFFIDDVSVTMTSATTRRKRPDITPALLLLLD